MNYSTVAGFDRPETPASPEAMSRNEWFFGSSAIIIRRRTESDNGSISKNPEPNEVLVNCRDSFFYIISTLPPHAA
jgi:hypothetical protein